MKTLFLKWDNGNFDCNCESYFDLLKCIAKWLYGIQCDQIGRLLNFYFKEAQKYGDFFGDFEKPLLKLKTFLATLGEI